MIRTLLVANQETITSHLNQSGVLFQLTFSLSSMIQVKLMNVIISLTSLSTIVIRLIAIQVLRGYLQAHLHLQTMYIVQRNLSRCVQVYKYGICYSIYYITVSVFYLYLYAKSVFVFLSLSLSLSVFFVSVFVFNLCLYFFLIPILTIYGTVYL